MVARPEGQRFGQGDSRLVAVAVCEMICLVDAWICPENVWPMLYAVFEIGSVRVTPSSDADVLHAWLQRQGCVSACKPLYELHTSARSMYSTS